MKVEMSAAFDKRLYTELVGLMDKHFGSHSYSLSNLFRDEQRKILNLIIEKYLAQSIGTHQNLFEQGHPLMKFIQQAGMPIPKMFLASAQPTLNCALKTALSQEEIDSEAVQRIVDHIKEWQVAIEVPDTEYFLRCHMQKLTGALREDPSNLKLMSKVQILMEHLKSVPVDIVLWQIQNDYYEMAKTIYLEYLAKERNGDEEAAIWLEVFRKLGESFYFNLGAVLPEQ